MAKSTTQIQKESDARRGLKLKATKLPVEIVALLEQLSKDTGTPQNQIIAEGIQLWATQQK